MKESTCLMPRFLRIALTGLAFLIFIGGSATIGWLLIPIKRRQAQQLPHEQRRVFWAIFFFRCHRWAIDTMTFLGLLELDAEPLPDDFPRDQPFVLIANHPSLLDVVVLRAVVPGATCLVKAKLFKKPYYKGILHASGDFPGPESNKQEIGTTAVLDTFVDRLRRGFPVLVFPEGTRSPAAGFRRFRRGAVEAACRAGVPVVPIFLWVDPPTLKKGQPWYEVPDRRVRFVVKFLPIVETKGKDSASLTSALRAQYDAKLQDVLAQSPDA